MRNLTDRRVVLGVTGGIAAYKAVEVCRRLVDAGAHVIPVLTESACRMVGPPTFSALASERARTSLFDDPGSSIPHTELGQSADLIVVCPATARVISDLRSGRSGDLLTATLLATRAPIVVCPAMHTEMWEQVSVQENLSVLAERGVVIVSPESGRLAGGDLGEGRLAAPERILAAVSAALAGGSTADYAGRRVLVTAGGTREPIDAVRYIGNRSSGRQGHAFAAEARSRGADVVLITTSPETAPDDVDVVDVASADEMAQACSVHAAKADVVVMAAAVADFRPAEPVDHKLKKSGGVPQIELVPTLDILAGLGAVKPERQILIGFAAETDELESNAAGKLDRKNLDMIIANDVSKPGVGFEHETNEVVVLTAGGARQHLPLCDKRDVARYVLDAAIGLIERQSDNQEQT